MHVSVLVLWVVGWLILGACVGCGGSSGAPPETPTAVSEQGERGQADAAEGASDAPAQDAPATKPVAAPPPDFELPTLDGDSVRLSDHLGKNVVLIDFWATFCDPCLTAMPHLDELYRKYQDRGFVILGVSIDGPDSIAQVRTEVSKLGVTFPILLDQETRVVSLYNPKTSAPYSVLIGRDGGVISKKEGYTTGDAAAVERDIVAALE